jgi:hypothetical protein
MKTVQPWAYIGTTWHSMWWGLLLAYQPAVQRSYDGRTAGMFGAAAMAEPWDGVGTATMAGTHKAQDGASGWLRCSHRRWNLSGYVTSLMRPLNNLVVIFLAHTSEVCKVARRYNEYSAF